MPTALYEECHEKGPAITWYCPNGHPRVFRESEADKLRREVNRLKQQAAQKDDEIATEQKARRAAETATARLKKRTAAGVCPCCNRSFVALARHIKTKHPTFDPAVSAKIVSIAGAKK